MAIFNNLSSQVQATDVGIKISKPTYDATRTTGQNLVFSSSWPSLPIVFELTITSSAQLATFTFINGTYAIPHGLKYPPLAFYWQPGAGNISNTFSRDIASVDSTYVYVASAFGPGTSTPAVPIDIKAFGIDLRVDADYTLAPGDTSRSAYDPNFGIKVVKSGKDINSKDLRDFILHSRAQSPLILAVKTEKTINPANTGVIQYSSGLKYQTWVYGFVRQIIRGTAPTNKSDFFLKAPYYSQAFPKTVTDGITSSITFGGGQASGATLVVLRDPMFAANQVTAQY